MNNNIYIENDNRRLAKYIYNIHAIKIETRLKLSHSEKRQQKVIFQTNWILLSVQVPRKNEAKLIESLVLSLRNI